MKGLQSNQCQNEFIVRQQLAQSAHDEHESERAEKERACIVGCVSDIVIDRWNLQAI